MDAKKFDLEVAYEPEKSRTHLHAWHQECKNGVGRGGRKREYKVEKQ